MAILINKKTGLAEEIPQEEAKKLAESTHELPLLNREGVVVSSSLKEAPNLLKMGYKHASQEHLDKLLHKAEYGTTGQMAKTVAESFGRGLTLGASEAGELAAGVKPEDIKSREEVNPTISKIGETAGSIASMFIPGAPLRAVGRVARLGIAGKGPIAQAGAAAIRSFAEGAAIASGDELHKMFMHDPHQSVGTALTHIGLTGLLTGSLGAAGSSSVQALKSAKLDPKLSESLASLREKAWEMAPEAVGAVGSMVLGHGILPGGIAGHAIKYMSKKLAPEAMELAKAKFLSQAGELSTQGFKALSNLAQSAVDGNRLINKAVRAVLSQEASNIADKYKPSEKSRKMLDSLVSRAEMDPTRLETDDLATYGSEYAAAATEQMARAVQVLSSLRPSRDKLGTLDPQRTPSKPEQAQYDRALDIAQQPLTILDLVRKGNLTPQDMHVAMAVHPELLDVLRSKLANQIAELQSKGDRIPHKSIPGLSLLIGQPLTASTMPYNMQSNQQIYQPILQQQPTQPKPIKRKPEALDKVSKQEALPGQAREAAKQVRR